MKKILLALSLCLTSLTLLGAEPSASNTASKPPVQGLNALYKYFLQDLRDPSIKPAPSQPSSRTPMETAKSEQPSTAKGSI